MKYLLLFLCVITYTVADEIAETHYVIHPHDDVRKIDFNVYYENQKKHISIYELTDLNLDKKITTNTLFSIGTELHLQIKFLDYETIEQDVVIQPGIGNYQITCKNLNRLNTYPFTLRRKQLIVDGVKYKYEFSIDEQPIEKHLFLMQPKNLYNIKSGRYTKKVRISCGFYYSDFHTTTRLTNVFSLKNISIEKYIKHLKKIQVKGAIFGKVLRFIKSHKSALVKSSMYDIEKLMNYLQSLELSNRDQMYLDNVLIHLEEILEETNY